MLDLDHLVVAGETLAEAQDHIEQALGVPMQTGGQHLSFGTHNALLHLADGIYLEAIAKDPTLTPERRPCWYALDHFTGAPRLANWACRTDTPDAAADLWPEAGPRLPIARGAYRWQMFVPRDGQLPYDNLFPALLSWQGPHPAAQLAPQGCALRRFVVTHPDAAALRNSLTLSDPRVVFEPGAPGLCAEIDTPNGLRHL